MRVGIAQFKAKLAACMDKVIAGEPVIVTRRGKVIAEIWPPAVPMTERITYSILTDPKNAAEVARASRQEPTPAPPPLDTWPKLPFVSSADMNAAYLERIAEREASAPAEPNAMEIARGAVQAILGPALTLEGAEAPKPPAIAQNGPGRPGLTLAQLTAAMAR